MDTAAWSGGNGDTDPGDDVVECGGMLGNVCGGEEVDDFRMESGW